MEVPSLAWSASTEVTQCGAPSLAGHPRHCAARTAAAAAGPQQHRLRRPPRSPCSRPRRRCGACRGPARWRSCTCATTRPRGTAASSTASRWAPAARRLRPCAVPRMFSMPRHQPSQRPSLPFCCLSVMSLPPACVEDHAWVGGTAGAIRLVITLPCYDAVSAPLCLTAAVHISGRVWDQAAASMSCKLERAGRGGTGRTSAGLPPGKHPGHGPGREHSLGQVARGAA